MALLKPPATPAIREKMYKNQRPFEKLRSRELTPPTIAPHRKNLFGLYRFNILPTNIPVIPAVPISIDWDTETSPLPVWNCSISCFSTIAKGAAFPIMKTIVKTITIHHP